MLAQTLWSVSNSPAKQNIIHLTNNQTKKQPPKKKIYTKYTKNQRNATKYLGPSNTKWVLKTSFTYSISNADVDIQMNTLFALDSQFWVAHFAFSCCTQHFVSSILTTNIKTQNQSVSALSQCKKQVNKQILKETNQMSSKRAKTDSKEVTKKRTTKINTIGWYDFCIYLLNRCTRIIARNGMVWKQCNYIIGSS